MRCLSVILLTFLAQVQFRLLTCSIRYVTDVFLVTQIFDFCLLVCMDAYQMVVFLSGYVMNA